MEAVDRSGVGQAELLGGGLFRWLGVPRVLLVVVSVVSVLLLLLRGVVGGWIGVVLFGFFALEGSESFEVGSC